jgi:hypothetical protein
MEANFFFYDGLYWIYQDDNWYESSWYNGPWWLVDPDDVPLYLLRVPVRYYRMPPAYFIGWQFDAPPRWGDHWGHDWNQRRSGWDRWDHRSIPTPAPLPAYQRQYSGDRYPKQVEQQRELHQQNYHFQPRDPVVRKQYQEQTNSKTPAQQENPQQNKQNAPENKGTKQQGNQRTESSRQESSQQATPPIQDKPESRHDQSTRSIGENIQRSAPAASQPGLTEARSPRQKSEQGTVQSEVQKAKQQNQKAKQQDNNAQSEPKQEQRQERSKGRNE